MTSNTNNSAPAPASATTPTLTNAAVRTRLVALADEHDAHAWRLAAVPPWWKETFAEQCVRVKKIRWNRACAATIRAFADRHYPCPTTDNPSAKTKPSGYDGPDSIEQFFGIADNLLGAAIDTARQLMLQTDLVAFARRHADTMPNNDQEDWIAYTQASVPSDQIPMIPTERMIELRNAARYHNLSDEKKIIDLTIQQFGLPRKDRLCDWELYKEKYCNSVPGLEGELDLYFCA
ncbi:hypothetical protein EJ04DRAFT_570744 [Polyplosphaeria fusca]|uniref:Uncharacterized protein n=1 Tax=Polyplosphaeria fusca TaxID=682080 RepID=A0A9P4UVP7_9PLEO|nr:hypothetical protein EJ04DRAFT_570744 [Polyplosphaeria fusca]